MLNFDENYFLLGILVEESPAILLNHCGDAVRLSSLAAPQFSPRSFTIAADGCSAVKIL
jgi:hypothetical protein